MSDEEFHSNAKPPKLGESCFGCEKLVWDEQIVWMEDDAGAKYPMCGECAMQPWPMSRTTPPWPHSSSK